MMVAEVRGLVPDVLLTPFHLFIAHVSLFLTGRTIKQFFSSGHLQRFSAHPILPPALTQQFDSIVGRPPVASTAKSLWSFVPQSFFLSLPLPPSLPPPLSLYKNKFPVKCLL